MKRMNVLATLSVASLLASSMAYAGGAACEGGKDAEASAKACKVSGKGASAQLTGAGGHCDMGKGASAMAEGKACALGANQMVYSFKVPSAECDNCATGISNALLATKGIHCAHVDLKARVAYVVAETKMDKKALAKVIADAGFKNSFRGDGKNVRAEFTKMIASSDKAAGCCASKEKAKDKV
jgi:copper chaperone CopZ